MKQAEGITEALKERDQLRWVGLLNNIRACAEEIKKSFSHNMTEAVGFVPAASSLYFLFQIMEQV